MSAKSKSSVSVAPVGKWGQWLALAAGLIVGLCLLKFGIPIVLPQAHASPGEFGGWLSDQWPVEIAYFLLIGLFAYGFMGARIPRDIPKWLLWAPMAWLGWQVLATMNSTAHSTSTMLVMYFGIVVGCYYLGLLALSRLSETKYFWIPIGLALLWVLWTGFEQEYGGAASTAQYIEDNQAKGWTNLPPNELQGMLDSGVVIKQADGTYTVLPEVLKRAKGGRISGTFVYANALAGIILLVLPAILVTLWSLTEKLPKLTRMVVFGMVFYLGVACLVWSGSKAGWLVAMVMVLAALLAQPLPKQWKAGIITAVLVLGIAGFAVKYAGYFQKGATSVGARFDYWSAAVKLTKERPLLGHGPGAFGQGYSRLKSPESEPTRLTHNDYLEQACDSGLPGAILFLAWIGGSMFWVWRKGMGASASGLTQAVAIGLIGWALQSFVEFSLYIPAIAWTAMMLLGWVTGMPPAQTASSLTRSVVVGPMLLSPSKQTASTAAK